MPCLLIGFLRSSGLLSFLPAIVEQRIFGLEDAFIIIKKKKKKKKEEEEGRRKNPIRS
jgi:hypothetical protein